jgi:adenylate cyclase
MPLEIERKFLLASEDWRFDVYRTDRLTDGLIATSAAAKVRVRLSGKSATIAVKSNSYVGVRAEYEYGISQSEAQEMLVNLCQGNILYRKRHYIKYEGYIWHVDEYDDILAGTIIAEVDLADISADLPLPAWVGREVTGDPQYRKTNMINARKDGS